MNLGDQLTSTAESFFVGLAAALCAFEALGAPAGRAPRGLGAAIAPGLAVGAAVWAQSLMGVAWPSGITVTPGLALASLVMAVLGAVAAFEAYGRCEGRLCLISGGAILGLGAAASQGATLLALRGVGDALFDSTPFFASVSVASAGATAALLIFRRSPTSSGQSAAALCLAAGLVVSAVLAKSALVLPAAPAGGVDAGEATRLAGVAAALALIVAVAARRLGRASALRRATRVRA